MAGFAETRRMAAKERESPKVAKPVGFKEARKQVTAARESEEQHAAGPGLGGPRQLAEGIQSGFLKGMSAATGFAEDIPGWALEAAGVELPLQLGPYAHIGKPGHAERRNQRLAEEGKIHAGQAPTTMGRIGERGGEVGAFMVPATSALRGAAKIAPVFKSSKFAPVLSNIVTKPWRAEKAGQLLREMGIGVQFGLAGGVAEETLPESMPGRQGAVLAAEFAGPSVGSGIAKATKLAGRRIAAADPSKLPEFPRAIAETMKSITSGAQKLATGESAATALARKQEADALDVAATEFRAASEKSTGAVLEDIRAYRGLLEERPGVELPIAKVTGERGGLGTQAADLSHYNTKFSGELKAARERAERALQAELRETAPNQSAGAARVAQLVEKTNAREMEALDGLVAEAKARAEAEVASAGGQVRPEDAATRAAQLINETLMPYMRARQKELYDDIPEVMLSTAKLKGAIDTQFGKMSPFMRESVGKLPTVERIKNLPDEIPFSEFRDIRKVLNDELSKASGGTNVNKTAARVLADTKYATGGILDEMMLNNTDAVAASRYRAADDYTHDALKHLQDYSAGGRVTGLGAGKQVPGSASLKQYAHTGDGAPEDAQEWKALLQWMRKAEVPSGDGGAPRTMSAEADKLSKHMEDYLISSAFESSGIANDSPRVANNLAAWAKAHRPMLEQFPEVRLKLSNVESAKRMFAERVQARDVASKDFEKSVASSFLNKPVDVAIDAALRPVARHGMDSGKALRNLLTRAGGSPEAEDGIARALWDRMMRDAFRDELEAGSIARAVEETPEILFPANLLRFHDRHEGVLSKWWSRGHVKKLHDIGILANRNQQKLEGPTSRPQGPQSDQFLSNAKYYNRPASHFRNALITSGGGAARATARFLDFMFEAFPSRVVVEHLERAHLPGGDAHAELLLRHVTPEQAGALLRQFTAGRIVGALPTDDRGKPQRRFPQ